MRNLILVAAASVVLTLAAPVTNVPITKYAGSVKPNSYIIKLKNNASKDSHIADLLSISSELKITYKYKEAFHGYAVELQGGALDFVKRSSQVEYIIEDGFVALDSDVSEPVGEMKRIVMQEDQLPMSIRTDGAGVDIYSLDTGIQINHTSFGGRAHWGKTFGGYRPSKLKIDTAGTAVGDAYGVATSSNIIAVKVLDDSGLGQWSDIIAGIDYVIAQSTQFDRPSIATLSLSGSRYTPVDMAVTNAISKGIHFTVAAGNLGIDAGGSSPAHVEAANTIGATDSNNARAWLSNFGSSIDVWALGVDVTSAWIGPSGTETMVLSGTSMATPFVADLSKDLKNHARPVVKGAPNGTTNLLVAQW
ncbi:hypothetical protein OPQ81_010369 [Rhizoctonia solani]|nr:hypothetical protein OPQ81_010369 [Rhizoctonia solani]